MTQSDIEDLDDAYATGAVDLIRELQRQLDPAMVARHESVAGHVEAQLDALARLSGMAPARLQWADFPPWIRLQILDLWTRWNRGDADMCRHDPDPRTPTPVVAALWRPGLVACHRCAAGLLDMSDDLAATCDACGRVTAGPETDDPIYAAAATFGPILLNWGTCGDCRPTWARDGRPPPKTPKRRTGRPRRPHRRR